MFTKAKVTHSDEKATRVSPGCSWIESIHTATCWKAKGGEYHFAIEIGHAKYMELVSFIKKVKCPKSSK